MRPRTTHPGAPGRATSPDRSCFYSRPRRRRRGARASTMNPIRHAVPASTLTIISARSRETRLAQAALFSAAVLFGAVSCADGPTGPLAPSDPFLGLAQQYDSVAPLAAKEEP